MKPASPRRPASAVAGTAASVKRNIWRPDLAGKQVELVKESAPEFHGYLCHVVDTGERLIIPKEYVTSHRPADRRSRVPTQRPAAVATSGVQPKNHLPIDSPQQDHRALEALQAELIRLREELKRSQRQNLSPLHTAGLGKEWTQGTSGAKVEAASAGADASAWGVAGWLRSLPLAEVVAKALQESPAVDPFEHVRSLTHARLDRILTDAGLAGLLPCIWSGIEKLRSQEAATGAALNTKFAAEGDAVKGEMGFGGVEQFYGGALWALLSPVSCFPAAVYTVYMFISLISASLRGQQCY